jgi:hypothetical protein
MLVFGLAAWLLQIILVLRGGSNYKRWQLVSLADGIDLSAYDAFHDVWSWAPSIMIRMGNHTRQLLRRPTSTKGIQQLDVGH